MDRAGPNSTIVGDVGFRRFLDLLTTSDGLSGRCGIPRLPGHGDGDSAQTLCSLKRVVGKKFVKQRRKLLHQCRVLGGSADPLDKGFDGLQFHVVNAVDLERLADLINRLHRQFHVARVNAYGLGNIEKDVLVGSVLGFGSLLENCLCQGCQLIG